MKRALFLTLACMMFLSVSTQAQQRKRSVPKQGTSTSSKTETSSVLTAGAQRVGDQIKLLSKFLYLLGGVTKGIEAADAAAQRGEATQVIIDQTQQSKGTVRNSIQNFREALDDLEIEFRTKPELQRYYTKLAGSASGAASAEDLANQGQFEQAGRSLLNVVYRLTDVLLEIKNTK